MAGAILSTTGLVASLAGVVLLFRYGMPNKTRTGGASFLITEQSDTSEAKREARYSKLGRAGLALIVVGTAFQIAGAWRAQGHDHPLPGSVKMGGSLAALRDKVC